MVIKAIVFDCFGVIVMSRRDALMRDFPQIKEAYPKVEASVDLGRISHGEFNKLLASMTGLSQQKVEEEYWKTNRINNRIVDYIKKLKASGKYKLSLLTNINLDLMSEYIDFFKQNDLFDDMVISSEVGLIKPDKKIFELTASRLGLNTNECVMIDDRMVNIDGAKSAGMQAIQFISNNQIFEDIDKLLERNRA